MLQSDEFYVSDDENDEMMKPLISFQRRDDSPDLNEKSNLVNKKPEDMEDISSDPLDLTDLIGKSGCWQIKILILTMIPGALTAWNHLAMSFLAYPVEHWCSRPATANLSIETWRSKFIPNTTVQGLEKHSSCEMFFYNETTGNPVTSKIIPCDSYDYALDFTSVVNKWNLVCNQEWILSASQTVYMIGFLLAVLCTGQFADVYGRQPAIMINCVILLVAGFVVPLSTSFLMFTVFRFFVAFGYSGLGLVSYILLIETIGSEYRVLYMYLQGFGWHLGYLVLPLIAWCEPEWWKLQLIITAPSIMFLSYHWLLPESPRWLLANGKVKQALPILESAALMNGKDTKDMEVKANILVSLNAKGKENDSANTILDLLRTPNLRMKTLCLYFIWAVIAFVYYGLSLNTNDLQGSHYINFFMSGLMEIPASIFGMVTLNRFGRKKPFFLTLLVAGLSCFACIFVPSRYPMILTYLAMVGKLFNSASFSIVYVFSAEIFPTVARNVGVGSCSTVARVGSAIAPFMKDLGSMTYTAVPLVIFGVLSIISALIVLKMPETNNCPIPESIDQAEEFGKES